MVHKRNQPTRKCNWNTNSPNNFFYDAHWYIYNTFYMQEHMKLISILQNVNSKDALSTRITTYNVLLLWAIFGFLMLIKSTFIGPNLDVESRKYWYLQKLIITSSVILVNDFIVSEILINYIPALLLY